MRYKTAILGGTFDRLHKGHKEFLRHAFSIADHILIGITSDEYVKTRKSKDIESFSVRKKVLDQFLQQQGWESKVTVYEIDDEFGPALSGDLLIDAIVVTEDTLPGAEKVNQARKQRGLSDLIIDVVPLVANISSSRIRSGEISRDGDDYALDKTLVLGPQTRELLKKPLGEAYPSVQDWKKKNPVSGDYVVTVGDETTLQANLLGLAQKISVVDFFVERRRRYEQLGELGFMGTEKVVEAENPAGTIQKSVFDLVKSSVKGMDDRRIVMQIAGEEDLLVIPFILTLPLGYFVLYGQPKTGVIVCKISEELKQKIREITLNFDR